MCVRREEENMQWIERDRGINAGRLHALNSKAPSQLFLFDFFLHKVEKMCFFGLSKEVIEFLFIVSFTLLRFIYAACSLLGLRTSLNLIRFFSLVFSSLCMILMHFLLLACFVIIFIIIKYVASNVVFLWAIQNLWTDKLKKKI